jgi:hypothetical protein
MRPLALLQSGGGLATGSPSPAPDAAADGSFAGTGKAYACLSARRERSGEHSRATAQIEHAFLAARQFMAIAAIIRPAVLEVIELHKLRVFKKLISHRARDSSRSAESRSRHLTLWPVP